MIMICDFCIFGRATSMFVIPMGFSLSVVDDLAQLTELDGGRWPSCDDCEPLVEQREEAELTARVMSVFRESGLLSSFSPEELAAIESHLDGKFTALFDADPIKQPI
ncbi:hypothetical protein ACFVTF_26430 [Kitasatospora sp. NPDC057940]|uniref:hypothetical protein n=1 Tax=Kitasatospora sp. NPDC057940 TaxID=3346285 RepID=UPI0036DA4155